MSRRFVRAAAMLLIVLVAVPVCAQPPKKPAPKRPAKPAAKTAAPAPAPEPPPPPDLLLSTRYVSGDKTTKSTLTLHGARERIDYETALATIQQCDASRTIQLNTRSQTYLPSPFPSDATPTPPAPGEKRKGGEVTFTTVVTDTGEHKDMSGFTARHLKTVVTKTSTPDACDKTAERVEIDGWYITAPASTTCTGAPPLSTEVRVDPQDASCRDTVKYVRPAAPVGFPLAYTMVTTAGGDAPLTTTMEATEVKRIAADAALFDVPADYVEVKTAAQLAADHKPGEDGEKKPGTIRIGVAPVGNKTGQTLALKDLSEALVESLQEVQPDVVLLKSESPKEIETEAKARQVDYVLQDTVTDIKRPGKGMMGKLSGGSADEFSAKVDYALVAPGQPKPSIAGSEHSGTSLLRTTVNVAKRVTAIVAPFMLGYGYMNAFSAMSGKASPMAMQQTSDPVLSGVFSLVDRATAAKPQPVMTTGDGAVAAALQRAVDAVAAALKKKT